MPTDNKDAFIEDMKGVVPNATQPKPPIKPPSERKLNRQVEKAQNKANREARKQQENDYAKEQKERAKNPNKDYSLEGSVMRPASAFLEDDLKAAADARKEAKDQKNPGETKEEATRRKETADRDYYKKVAEAYGTYAESYLHGDKQEKRRARDEQEKAQLEADSLDRKLKIDAMEATPEKSKLMDTYKRHKWFDRMKTIFRRDNALSHQDVTFQRGEQEFTNVGRAFYGGTKPMYKFKDQDGNTHLYKEAVNCLGMKKPTGALVTEAASKIQQMVCGDAYVPAFAVKSKEGNVLGSMQQMLVKDDNGIDLFALQDDVTKLGETLKERPELGKELIREHALDWMLCNFDTKGENFIPLKTPNPDGSTITSIDKEAAFNHLSDPASQTMSYTYKPHSNNTFYNVMFQAYAEGKVDLPMEHMDTMVKKIEGIDDKKYMDCFSDMLDDKYGQNTPERQKAYDAILERKTGIGMEYDKFKKQLNLERTKNMEMGDKAKEVTEPEKVVAEPEKAKVTAEPEKAKVTAEPEKTKVAAAPEKVKSSDSPAKKETSVQITLKDLEKISAEPKRAEPKVKTSHTKAPTKQAKQTAAPTRGK